MIWQTHTPRKTGQENFVVFYCQSCGYRFAAQPWPLLDYKVDQSRCGQCHKNLHFIAFEDPKESSLVEDLIGHYPAIASEFLG